MSWLTRTTWATGQPIAASDLNNFGLDLRTQGSDADGGGYGRANQAFLTLNPADLIGTAYTVTAASWSSGTVTYTIGAHNIIVGQFVSVSGATPSAYNALIQVSSVTGTTVSGPMVSNPGSWSSGGTATVATASGGGATGGMLAVTAAKALEIYNGSVWVTIGGGGLNINSKANKSTAQSISNASGTVLTWDTNEYDNGGVHSTSTNPTRFTVPSAQGGIYLCVVQYSYGASAAGTLRQAYWQKNGVAAALGAGTVTPVVNGRVQAVLTMQLAAGDYMEAVAYQDSGGAQNTNNAAGETWASVCRLA